MFYSSTNLAPPPWFSSPCFIFKFQDGPRGCPELPRPRRPLPPSLFPPDRLQEKQFASSGQNWKIVVTVMADKMQNAVEHVIFRPHL